SGVIVPESNATNDSNAATGFDGYMSSVMSPVETQTVKFKNTVKVDTLYDLKINKTIELIDTDNSDIYNNMEFSVEVKLDGVPLPVGTTYLVGTEERTVQTEGIIKIKANQTVTIIGIVDGATYTVKEVFDNGPAGFVAQYTGGTAATGGGVTGVIDSTNNNVTITINNVQCGAEIPLTISKQLVNATDNSNFTFKFSVYQIDKVSGNYIVDNSEEIDIIEITISGKENNGIVTEDVLLKYLAEDFDVVGDTYLYYKIIEATDNGEKVSIIDYDSTAYVVTVKVNKDAEGNLTAEIESIEKFKDGNVTDKETQGNYESIDDLNGSVAFVNTLNLYSLPETGGSGEKFTASQFALGYVLLVGAVVFLMCCFTDKGRRDDSKKDKP
ncbi:MAG: hypothetical protein J6C24_03715, partial [Clostridia bacterium]|nr:hypothetical protein [Clostridia bacterium]